MLATEKHEDKAIDWKRKGGYFQQFLEYFLSKN